MTFEVSFHLSEQRMMPLSSVQLFQLSWQARDGLTLLHHHLRIGFKPRNGPFVEHYLLMDLTI